MHNMVSDASEVEVQPKIVRSIGNFCLRKNEESWKCSRMVSLMRIAISVTKNYMTDRLVYMGEVCDSDNSELNRKS